MKYILIIVLALSLSVCQTENTVKTEPFTVKLDSPKISLGKVDVMFDRLMGLGLHSGTITVDYYPLEDAVCFQYRVNFMTYYLFWDRKGRAAYMRALEQYKEDYANQTLKNNGSRSTKRKYGSVQCYLIWQAAAYTRRAMTNMNTEIGYDIKIVSENKASFFVLYQRDAEYRKDESTKEIRNTQGIFIYLSRAKADELAGFFDQELLNSVVSETNNIKSNPLIIDNIDPY